MEKNRTDFLARFKGRTNFLTKQGPNSLMSEASTPVLKVHSQPDPSSPSGLGRGLKHRASHQKPLFYTEEKFTHKAALLTEPAENKMYANRMGGAMNKMNHYRKPSSQNDLHLETEHHFYGNDREQFMVSPKHAYFTPQNNYMGGQGHEDSFSKKVNNLKNNQMNPGYASPKMNPNGERALESPSYRQNQGSNLIHRPNDLNNSHRSNVMMKPGFKFQGELTPVQNEERVSKMGFVERQEKVLSKYRPTNINVKPDGYAAKYLNRSVDTKFSGGKTPKY